MKKTILILILVLAVSLSAEGWKKTGNFSLMLSQSYYSDNWTGTEIGNVAWSASFNFIMEKQLNAMLYDKNTLIMSFGQTHNQIRDEAGDLYWEKPTISTDLIDYENMLSFTLHKFVDPYLAFRWESFFVDESDSLETFYINPNTLTFSLGARKDLIKKDKQNLEMRLGAAYKNILNQNSAIDSKSNAGAEMVLAYWYVLPAESGKFDSSLRLYQAVLSSEDEDDVSDNWKALDVEFKNTLTFKLSSYIGLKLYLEMLYDKEILDETRYKEILGINLSYSIF
ncbi:MAG: DUF481 domain-containing protein [Candidatus Cloacimonetes bacterium]|nr:DUF481 domain-containing protein [Candidatus Cloacimonadota bacterium]